MAINLQARVDQVFRKGTPQHAAASEALTQVARGQALEPSNVDAWLGYLQHHGGVVHELPAARILKAFLALPPIQERTQEQPLIKASNPAALMFRATNVEVPWTDRIEARDIPGKVAGFEADLRWLSALDLGDPRQYLAFADWAGWTSKLAEGATSSFQHDATVLHWLGGELAHRHGLTRMQRQEIVAIFAGPQAERSGKVEAFIDATAPSVTAIAKRTAVFNAFFMAMGHTRDLIMQGGTTEAEQRALLESKLGLMAGSIQGRSFEGLLDYARSIQGTGRASDADLANARRYDTVLAFEREYVREKPAFELLKANPTFGVLPDEVLRGLIAAGLSRTAYDARALFKAGDPATAVILLLDGSATVSKTYDGPTIATLGPGSIAGARFLAGEETRGAFIHPDMTMQVLELPGPFAELRKRYPAFNAQVAELVQDRKKQISEG